MDYIILIWIIIILTSLIPQFQRKRMEYARLQLIRSLERQRKSRVITMIHRQETLSFFGLPLARFIDIEDSEKILRAIRLTPDNMPIDLVLHTPGGLVLASEQIACALKRHPARVSVLIPHYAMSGGTLIALAADEIALDSNAVLGPVDPQLSMGWQSQFPAVSILAALKEPNPNRDDQTLILGDVAAKAIRQVNAVVFNLLEGKMENSKAKKLAKLLSEGHWTHDYPITVDELKRLDLPIKAELPQEIYRLMNLYPQPAQRRPSVEFIPTPYPRPSVPTKERKNQRQIRS
jgi:ClpP class serine protease